MNYDQIKIELTRLSRTLFSDYTDQRLFVIICYVEIDNAYRIESNKQAGYLIDKYKSLAVDKVNRIIDKNKIGLDQYDNYTLKDMKEQYNSFTFSKGNAFDTRRFSTKMYNVSSIIYKRDLERIHTHYMVPMYNLISKIEPTFKANDILIYNTTYNPIAQTYNITISFENVDQYNMQNILRGFSNLNLELTGETYKLRIKL